MNPMPELTPMLKELRLSGVMDSLEQRNRQAIEEKLAYTDFLALILQDEVARRAQKKLALALRRANFRNHKTLEQFDFTFNPTISRSLITDLATCHFIDEKVSVFIVGPCGTGKSHIGQALGHCAIRKGYDVLFTTQSKMLGKLHAARATDTYERQFNQLTKVSLLIIDDFGLKRLLGAATIDRLRHGAYKVVLEGKSFRCMKPDQKNTKSNSVVEVAPKHKSKKPDGREKGSK
jgi:DNA replication protein DnaC